MIIGYTTGVFDLFHIGHLKILNRARKNCDFLIVGVTTDDLMMKYKKKTCVIPFEERSKIVASIKSVDKVVEQDSMNKVEAWKKYKFNKMFVGDDWKGTEKWKKIEKEMDSFGVEVIFFPYTKGTSSTIINKTLEKLRGNELF
ncbi:MAG: glycerol-3-phosphate cytidylyltransferase [Rickettsiales bacterium]|nr:glycerol-3-phosphate cytidylyltransferase [Rickettsiales bacterium]|tara:strand:+ start:2097 stop:2525 length:429 start_codon:yes stop_codon:yes gene_type:complete